MPRHLSRLRALVVALLLVLLLPLSGVAAAQTRAPQTRAPDVVGVDVVTGVNPLGFRVDAVAIELASPLRLAGDIPESAFEVLATRFDTTAPRTVVDAYVHDEPATTDDPRPGRYLVLELSPDDPNASALVYTGINQPVPLDGAYEVTITEDLTNPGGRVVLPASTTPLVNDDVVNPVVDDFAERVHTDAAGTTLEYRFYAPGGPGDRRVRPRGQRPARELPLVVFLHGGGERGDNNLTQIAANEGAVAFADPERQATDPSFVLAAQVPVGSSWTTPEIQDALLAIIDREMARNPIDPDRVYLTGMSLGGIGTFDLLADEPDRFAAAVPIAAAGDPSRMPLIADVPIWATHSIDDAVVPHAGTAALIDALEDAGAGVVRGEWPGNLPEAAAEAAAADLWAEARATDSSVLFTTFPEGTTPVSSHWSWVPTYSNDVILDWLFAQERPS